MRHRLDHLVVGVRDLRAAMTSCRDAGFTVEDGGRHESRGTCNAIIDLGSHYIELLAFYDEAEAIAAKANAAVMAGLLRGRETVLLGFAVASSDLDADHRRCAAAGYRARLLTRSRTRPDGTVTTWRILAPDQTSWRRPWPFVIERARHPDPTGRARLPAPGASRAVTGLRIAVESLSDASRFYLDVLGLARPPVRTASHLVARRLHYVLDGVGLDLLEPTGDGPVATVLDDVGPGLMCATLAVPAGPP